MHFDLKLWRMTSGLRSRIALSAALGLLALAVGIARFAFLGQFLAGVFRGETLILPLLAAAAAILLAWFDHRRSRRTASASRHRHAALSRSARSSLMRCKGCRR
jgi:ATP-binding cassette subfamily C protein CydCD